MDAGMLGANVMDTTSFRSWRTEQPKEIFHLAWKVVLYSTAVHLGICKRTVVHDGGGQITTERWKSLPVTWEFVDPHGKPWYDL